jgi:hypothetical protein
MPKKRVQIMFEPCPLFNYGKCAYCGLDDKNVLRCGLGTTKKVGKKSLHVNKINEMKSCPLIKGDKK